MYYFDILTALAQAQVRYLIVGGLAVNLHGVPRVTQDIDLIISVEPDNVQKLCQALSELDYVPRLPVNPLDMANPDVLHDWVENRNLKAFSFYHRQQNYRVVDIVLVHPLDFEKAFAQKLSLNVQGVILHLLSIADLIAMKQAAGRQRDITDIDMLKKALDLEKDNDNTR